MSNDRARPDSSDQEPAPAAPVRPAPMAGKTTRTHDGAAAASPAQTVESTGVQTSGQTDGASAQRAGDWLMDEDLMAAMGLTLEDHASEQKRCALPSSPSTEARSAAMQAPGANARGANPLPRPSSQVGAARSGGSEPMWGQVVGQASTSVGKLARVSAPKGVRLRTGAAANQPDLGILPFDELVQVERRTAHGWCWVIPTGALAGKVGFCEEQFLSIDPPEPTAHLYRVEPGDQLLEIAQRTYGKAFRDDHDARLYVQALVEANKGRKGIYVTDVELGRKDTLPRGESEEHTLRVFRGAKVREGHSLWVPSEAFIAQLRASGAITSGSTDLSKAWSGAKEAVGAAVDVATYGAAFTVGLLEGAWNAIADLFQGAADMIELVAKTVYQLVTGNLGAIKATLIGWVDTLKAAWAGRDKIADDFMRQWESDDAWTRGNFQGEVLGWVMMTALLILATAGSSSLAVATGKWASVLRVLRTVDALGDITTYVGQAARLPGKATAVLRRKLGKGASEAAELADEALEAEGDAARAISHAEGAGEVGEEISHLEEGEVARGISRVDAAGDVGKVADLSKRDKKSNKPKMESVTTSRDGHTFHNDFRKMSGSARHVIRQLEERGWVRVAEILPEDLAQISKWFNKEIGVVQSPYGKLRIILGSEGGVIRDLLRPGEVFVVHTHPVVTTVADHFRWDLKKAGKHIEAVVDWNGQITYYNKAGLKNPVRLDGIVEPLLGYEAAFMGPGGTIVGFAKVDVIDSATSTVIEVL